MRQDAPRPGEAVALASWFMRPSAEDEGRMSYFPKSLGAPITECSDASRIEG